MCCINAAYLSAAGDVPVHHTGGLCRPQRQVVPRAAMLH